MALGGAGSSVRLVQLHHHLLHPQCGFDFSGLQTGLDISFLLAVLQEMLSFIQFGYQLSSSPWI